jgi:flavin-dependent dehydrogenase
MMNTNYDVVIIGGGPAGSVAGIILSRAGLKVAVVERKSFPRETLCGEFLSFEVTENLKELNLFESFLKLMPNKISSFQLVTTKKTYNSDLPFTGYSIKRSIFDEFLIKEAYNSGAKIFQPAEVKSVKEENGIFNLQIKTNYGSEILSGNFVIGAYGKSNILDKRLSRKFSSIRSGYGGIKFHLNKRSVRNFDDSKIYIFSTKNIYCGINSVNKNEVTVCYLSKHNRENHSLKNCFEELFNSNKYFSQMFEKGFNNNFELQHFYGAGNIFFGKKELVKDGIIMVGDAANVIAPVVGDGIGMAFQSAGIAAGIIMDFQTKDKNFLKLERVYRTEWNSFFLKRIFLAKMVQKLVLKNHLNKIPSVIVNEYLPFFIKATRN